MKDKNKKNIEESLLMVEPLAVSAVEHAQEGGSGSDENSILQLQLTMATSSINHEYARIEYEDTRDQDRQEQLLQYMGDCREKYFEARTTLHVYDPNAVQEFESDLLRQKLETLSRHNA